MRLILAKQSDDPKNPYVYIDSVLETGDEEASIRVQDTLAPGNYCVYSYVNWTDGYLT